MAMMIWEGEKRKYFSEIYIQVKVEKNTPLATICQEANLKMLHKISHLFSLTDKYVKLMQMQTLFHFTFFHTYYYLLEWF